MAKKQRDDGGGGNWMDTYGDMVTLLMTFFICLYSMSSVQQDKWYKVVKAFNINGTEEVDQFVFAVTDKEGDGPVANSAPNIDNNESGNGTPDEEMDFSQLYNYLKEYVDENNMGDMIHIEQNDDAGGSGKLTTDDGDGTGGTAGNNTTQGKDNNNAVGGTAGYQNIYIQFSNSILFNPDEYTMLSESKPVLEIMGKAMKQYEGQIAKVIVKGYTADVPESQVDERFLSSNRASAICNYFEDVAGLNAELLTSQGMGNKFPVADNATSEGQAKNRRVEIVIIPKDSSTGQNTDWESLFGSYYHSKNMQGDIVDIVGK